MRNRMLLAAAACFAVACAGTQPQSVTAAVSDTLPPPPKHIVIVIEENRDEAEIEGNKRLTNFQALIAAGALFVNARGVTHPSLPNYFALFAGKTNTDADSCSDHATDAAGDLPMPSGLVARMPTLASELAAAHLTFTGFAESLPRPGYVGCYGRGGSLFATYYKRHVPWAFFTKAGHPGEAANDPQHYLLDDSVNQPWSAFPSTSRYDELPTVSIVVPNLKHDMHGAFIETHATLNAAADAWLGSNIVPLVKWARDPNNNTLVIVTWDESDRHPHRPDANDIATIFAGSMVRPGIDVEPITHYSVLATIEDFYGLPRLGNSAGAEAIGDCWNTSHPKQTSHPKKQT
jgi:acid phosphatase